MIGKGGGLRPSPAMVIAFIALFVALAGTAFSVGSRVPGKNGVKSSDIAPKAVKTSDLGGAAVTSNKLAASAATAAKLAANAVTGEKLAANAVTGEKLAANAVTGEKVAADALTGANISYGSHVVTGNNPEGADGATATCPAGEIATGGGADSADPADTGALLTSTPQPITGAATSWRVFYESTANAGDIFVFAICMPA
jgi:hypothetical protein